MDRLIDHPAGAVSLYRRILGDAFDALPAEVRTLHDVSDEMWASGVCTVERGANPVARLCADLFRMPCAGEGFPITVQFVCREGREMWLRRFPDTPLRTQHDQGEGRFAGHMMERFGPIAFALRLVPDAAGLGVAVDGMTVLGIPMPRPLWPRISVRESGADGWFVFEVAIDLPVLGRLIRYYGRLRPASVVP